MPRRGSPTTRRALTLCRGSAGSSWSAWTAAPRTSLGFRCDSCTGSRRTSGSIWRSDPDRGELAGRVPGGRAGDLENAREDEVPGQRRGSCADLDRPRRRAFPLAPRPERLAEARHLQLAGVEVGLDEERQELVVLPSEEKVRHPQIREERVRDR